MLDEIRKQAADAAEQLLEAAHLKAGSLVVVGCSSSEISDYRIGSHSSAEIGEAVFSEIHKVMQAHGVYLAAQCCEHLNRAIVLEAEAAEHFGLEPVNVVPQLKAGGSFATAAYGAFRQPTVVEHVRADAGIDIGDTLIGMHLKEVAVPVRTAVKYIGAAHVVCARTRPKYIGGSRAHYDEALM